CSKQQIANKSQKAQSVANNMYACLGVQQKKIHVTMYHA
ncbi:hypothetical protein ACN38_g13193, partial [Penicillium nordicum]